MTNDVVEVEFVRDFDWRVPGSAPVVVTAYKAGMRIAVSPECADAARAAGAIAGSARSAPHHAAIAVSAPGGDEDEAMP